ncbi:MAG: GFA family protein [Alphaproteobacteria bacterium]|nr:GFA family protein [Alphaproteobacteria bacterium]
MVQPTQPTKDIAGTRNEIHGRCHCGEITFDAEVDPGAVNTRHCTDCQTPSGSAFRVNIPAPAEHFVLLSGTPETYAKTAESCNKRLHVFCGTCATPIYACAVDNRRAMVCGRTITQRALFSRRRQSWRRSALRWVDSLAAVPASEKGATSQYRAPASLRAPPPYRV